MRRLLLISLVTALIVGAFASVASARLASGSAEPSVAAAPFAAPVAPPRADRTQRLAYGYRSAVAMGEEISAASGTKAAGSAGGGSSASVTVTAVVLPVVFLVVEPGSSEMEEVFTNTPGRDVRDVLYLVRSGSIEGEPRALTPEIWASARRALADARAGTGSVWRA